MSGSYCPSRGDIVWIRFHPSAGHEQSGERPALVLSPLRYNRRVGLALLCPITSQIKGYPFEIVLPEGLKASGVVLADQVRSLDWTARNARFCDRVPETILKETVGKIATLLQE